ncbi:beta-amylase 3, chloroplastic [Trifolium repens]|nr:beta-amylase 3, chloroplastic [Trifolium repens]
MCNIDVLPFKNMQILRNFRDIFKTFYLCYHYSKGVQIGKSPSGELRYPSLSSQKLNLAWSCELGEFQWCDKDVDEKQCMIYYRLIRDIFSYFEAQQIINLPLSWRLPIDRRIWHWERDGNFSVKSAHHMIKEAGTLNNPESSSSNGSAIWKAVWKIKAPHSVKNFLWRVARNILPTRGRLSKKVLLLKIGALLRLAC